MVPMTLQMWMVLVFLVIGLISDIVCFASPEWNDLGTETWGLWLRCTKESGCAVHDSSFVLSNIMEVGRACQVLGFLCYIILTLQTLLYVFWQPDIRLLSGAVITAFLALLSMMIGAVMWASASNTSLSWGYYVCYFSALAASATGGVLIHIRRQAFLANVDKSNAENLSI